MSDETNSGILSPGTQPILTVVVGVLAILGLILNFYNLSLVYGLTGATLALEQNAMTNTQDAAMASRVDAIDGQMTAMQTKMDEMKAMADQMMAANAAPTEGEEGAEGEAEGAAAQ